MRRAFTAAVACALIGAAVGACVARQEATAPDVSLEQPRLVHVHGLGVDARGALLVATHHGLFRLGASEPRPAPVPVAVSLEAHDFMGFTIVEAGRFVASGHPTFGSEEFGELERPLLGLVESRDGGRSWQPVSLTGEADFHTLEAAHGRIYGFDGVTGRLLVSDDGGQTWDVRSATPIHDLAVDPADADHLVASTPSGMVESTDGGRSWSPQGGAPEVVFVDWHARRGLWGLDVDGRVHHFNGAAWRAGAILDGSPQALLVHDAGVVAATDAGTTVIHRSDDGETWEVLYRAPAG